MKKYLFSIFALLLILSYVTIFPSVSLAQTSLQFKEPLDCGLPCHQTNTISPVLLSILAVLLILVLILAYSIFLWITSHDNLIKKKKVKLYFTISIVGIAIIIGVFVYVLGISSITHTNSLQSAQPYIGGYVKNNNTINVYIKHGISEAQSKTFGNLIQKQNGVVSVTYISADQALATFKSTHKNDTTVMKALNELGTNPLYATLVVTITNPAQRVSLLATIKSLDTNSIIDYAN